MDNFKIVFSLLTKKQKVNFYFLVIFLFIGVLFELLGIGILVPVLSLLSANSPLLKNQFIITILHKCGDPSLKSIIIFTMIFLIILNLFKAMYLIFLNWRQSSFATNLSEEITEKLFYSYLNQSYEFHIQRNSSVLLKNLQHDANQIMHICSAYIIIFLEFLVILGVIIFLFIIEPKGAITLVITVSFFSFLFNKLTSKKITMWGDEQNRSHSLKNQYILQALGGIKEIKILGRIDMFFNKFQKLNKNLSKIHVNYSIISGIPRVYLEFLAMLGLSILIVEMTLSSISIETILPVIGIFLASAFRLLPSINKIMGSLQLLKINQRVIANLNNEFNISEKVYQNVNNIDILLNNEIVFKNINYHYPNSSKNILENINFQIKKGDLVGIIGKSGSGKSTLIDLLIGVLIPSQGKICVDGIDINDNLASWQGKIGYVPQNIYLTDDSLKNNIALGIDEKDIDENLLNESIINADLFDFIQSLPKQLDTSVGERGVRLSGGQRQRIGIARALYHKPSILVLDEATSALDNETEKKVMNSVIKLKNKITIIVIAHRLTTLKECNYILKLQEGKLIYEDKTIFL
jgi:ABC-type multidrug transport system fused ATPase/permease subunit